MLIIPISIKNELNRYTGCSKVTSYENVNFAAKNEIQPDFAHFKCHTLLTLLPTMEI